MAHSLRQFQDRLGLGQGVARYRIPPCYIGHPRCDPIDVRAVVERLGQGRGKGPQCTMLLNALQSASPRVTCVYSASRAG
jgi:hypothetical protein